LPSTIIGDVTIQVVINSVSAIKLNEKPPQGELTFDVGAKLEEKEKRTNQVTVAFILTVGTKPSIVKFGVEGTATVNGKDAEIEKLLEIDPETKIPKVLHGVYQHIFMTLFLLSTIMGTPYPPPDLFYSSKQAPPNVEMTTAAAAGENLEATQQTTEKPTDTKQ
jgi:hypothetical protein